MHRNGLLHITLPKKSIPDNITQFRVHLAKENLRLITELYSARLRSERLLHKLTLSYQAWHLRKEGGFARRMLAICGLLCYNGRLAYVTIVRRTQCGYFGNY